MPKITKSLVDALTAESKDKWLWCSLLPGFGVRVQPSGRKTYVARYRTKLNQQRKITIGRCSDIPPDKARELARAAFGEVAAGRDPAQDRREARDAATMADLHERYMRDHARPFKKPSSIMHDERNWQKYVLPVLGKKYVEAVSKTDITSLHGSMADRPVTANHVRALLSKAFNLAIDWGWRTTTNPCIGVRKFKTRQRELILTPAQMQDLDRALTDLVAKRRIVQEFANLFRLLALTGCRLNEIQSARREWVDVERRLLILPDSKTGPRKINLPQAALDIIAAMPPNKWLIPGKIGGSHMTQPHTAWDRVVEHAGLPPETRIHDLRHTFGSIGHRHGLTQKQIADMLGHRNLATTERYLHGFVEDRAVAVDMVAQVVSSGWQK